MIIKNGRRLGLFGCMFLVFLMLVAQSVAAVSSTIEETALKIYKDGYVVKIKELDDGYLAGVRTGKKASIMRVSKDMSMQWVYNCEYDSYIRDVAFLDDGGSVFIAERSTSIGPRVRVIKIDKNGSLLWTKSFEQYQFMSIEQTSDGFYLAGREHVEKKEVASITKLSADGLSVLWSKQYAQASSDVEHSSRYIAQVVVLNDGSLVATGCLQDNALAYNYETIILDREGNNQIDVVVPTTGVNGVYKDGDNVLISSIDTDGFAYLTRADSNGNIEGKYLFSKDRTTDYVNEKSDEIVQVKLLGKAYHILSMRQNRFYMSVVDATTMTLKEKAQLLPMEGAHQYTVNDFLVLKDNQYIAGGLSSNDPYLATYRFVGTSEPVIDPQTPTTPTPPSTQVPPVNVGPAASNNTTSDATAQVVGVPTSDRNSTVWFQCLAMLSFLSILSIAGYKKIKE